ncbi:pinin/SDK/memA/ protein conserved region-domain-containing protein [Peziza echinospora]|nr:pinin/SDK/memA/ protein conserved region-domain-containing protein [Peziza echinospora]
MAEDQAITVASAVSIPDSSPDRPSKRRTSISSVDGSKRLRLDSTFDAPATTTTTTTTTEDAKSRNKDVTDRAPPRKRAGEGLEEQERKRGQRLFGALLGTIGKFQQDSQSARARAGATRRQEIEKKLEQKLKQQNEELDERRRKETDLLRARQAEEQKIFEERSMHVRHSNLRAQANFLCTKARPSLYYLPWKLTAEEEIRIKDQIEDTDALIQRELADFEAKKTGPAWSGNVDNDHIE